MLRSCRQHPRPIGYAVLALVLVGVSTPIARIVVAQSTSSYSLREHVVNADGQPAAATMSASASYGTSIESIGGGLVGPTMSSASDRVDGSFASAYPPPDEVVGLRFLDEQTLAWDPERSAGDYNIYRRAIWSSPDLTHTQFGQGFSWRVGARRGRSVVVFSGSSSWKKSGCRSRTGAAKCRWPASSVSSRR